jgi:hypothetical protein
VSNEDEDEIDGTLRIVYLGDLIQTFEVQTEGGLLRVRSPGAFLGTSAIRIDRIEGFLHLQRRDVNGTCEDFE